MLQRRFRPVGLLLSLALWCGNALALDPGIKDARSVAEAVEQRDQGDKMSSKVTLTLVDAGGRQRVRETRQMSLSFKDGKKTLIFFEAPASVRGTGILSVDYSDGGKEDEQWLHMPNLHKTTRIAGSEKSQSFMGTDLTYADLTTRDTKLYDYTMVEQSVKVDGEDCWLIEARPKTAGEKAATGYLKSQMWVSKSKLLPLRVKSWVIEGKKLKYLKFDKIEKVDGVWVAKELVVTTKRNEQVLSRTVMSIRQIAFGQASVDDGQFTKRRLEQGI